jgi:hypothetical protein
METIVLDYEKWETILITHDNRVDIETMLFEELWYMESAIEWMTTEKIDIKYQSYSRK